MNQQSPTISTISDIDTSKIFIFKDIGIILVAVIAQCWWTSIFVSTKVGLLNLLPTLVFIGLWYWFTKSSLSIQYSRWYFLLGFLITLRLPVTIAPQLEILNWALYLSMVGLIGYRFFEYFQQRKQLIVVGLAITI
ncbi:MAG: hypothetical protein IM556_15340, partial [Pseudanabaena sp. M110S1SP2A07QC]|nr:hypothetical protein [Pseudanabaena sp. M110S1SP2A07QC]